MTEGEGEWHGQFHVRYRAGFVYLTTLDRDDRTVEATICFDPDNAREIAQLITMASIKAEELPSG